MDLITLHIKGQLEFSLKLSFSFIDYWLKYSLQFRNPLTMWVLCPLMIFGSLGLYLYGLFYSLVKKESTKNVSLTFPSIHSIFVTVVQLLSHVRLCSSTDCSTPGFPVLHHLPAFAQTPVYWVSDAIQPSCSLSFPSPPAFYLPASGSFQMSQFFVSGGQSIGVSASELVLPMNIQDSFALGLTGLISLKSKEL